MENDSKLNPLIVELRSKVESLKQLLVDIANEFKSKGEEEETEDSTYRRYRRKRGLFFDPKKYAEETNNLVRRRAFEVLAVLRKIFPYIPGHIYYDLTKTLEGEDLLIKLHPLGDYCYLLWPVDGYPITIEWLINLCNLDNQKFLRQWQKVSYVALAHIFLKGKNIFSKEDFVDLRGDILDSAITIGILNGWIKEKNQKGVYEVIEKPESITIKCPHCESNVNVYEIVYTKKCPKCGLNILNMIMRTPEEEIPSEFYEINEKENKYIAYFYVDREKLQTDEFKIGRHTLADNFYVSIYLKFLMEDLVRELELNKLAKVIPDPKFYAEVPLPKLSTVFGYLYFAGIKTYFKVEGNSIKDIKRKIKRIIDLMRDMIEDSYDKEKAHYESDSDIVFKSKDDCVAQMFRICKGCFKPELERHPIFQIEEESAGVISKCPNCGSIMPTDAIFCGVCGHKLKSS